jgi:hypothetical protein
MEGGIVPHIQLKFINENAGQRKEIKPKPIFHKKAIVFLCGPELIEGLVVKIVLMF